MRPMTTILDRVRAHVHRAPPRRPAPLRLVPSPVVGTVSPAYPPTRGVTVSSPAEEHTEYAQAAGQRDRQSRTARDDNARERVAVASVREPSRVDAAPSGPDVRAASDGFATVAALPPTLCERVLMVAATLLPQPFTRADLVVASWKRWPETFALDGYPHLPSSNNVDPVVVKLVQRGLLDRVNGNLIVTRRGGQRARRLEP